MSDPFIEQHPLGLEKYAGRLNAHHQRCHAGTAAGRLYTDSELVVMMGAGFDPDPHGLQSRVREASGRHPPRWGKGRNRHRAADRSDDDVEQHYGMYWRQVRDQRRHGDDGGPPW